MQVQRSTPSRRGLLTLALVAASLPLVQAQSPEPAITLEKSATAESAIPLALRDHPAAQDYRVFEGTKLRKSSQPQVLTLNFRQSTKITSVSATADFHVTGGSCIEGHIYAPGDVCSVDVVFTPQGPGHRTGKLVIAHSASTAPFVVPTGGEGYGPAVSFIPAKITTVPATYVSGTGLLVNPQGLAVDGGDSLYIADTGNNLIRYQNSSGALSVLAGGGTNASPTFGGLATQLKLSSPYGVAVDSIGDADISDSGNNVVRQVNFYGSATTLIGGGSSTSSCTIASPCPPTGVPINSPLGIALDPSGTVFLNTATGGTYGAYLYQDTAEASPSGLWALNAYYDDFTTTYPLTVDSYDNAYTTFEYPGNAAGTPPQCYIMAQNQAYGDSSSAGGRQWIVAGSRACGFSGDGGLATGAEISSSVQGFAWDAAGNFYFTDTGNQRVRRIDAATGVIRTVAGNGASGYTGDGGPATSAAVWSPTGIAVDSLGDVYTTSVVATEKLGAVSKGVRPEIATGSESLAVVRKVGSAGALAFASQLVSTHSAAQTVLVSNTGNNTLEFTHVAVTSGNTGDFAIDPNTTSCNFTLPLYSGQNCNIGIIFTPAATGARSAVLTLLDNTVSGSNIVALSGTGATAAKAVLSPTSLVFTSQTAGTSSTAKPIALSNTGTLPLSITSYTISGTNASDFSQTHTCGTTLAGSSSCTISVIFKPAAAGARSATLSIGTASGTVTATLSGSSVAAAVKPKVTLAPRTNPAVTGRLVVLSSNVVGNSSNRVESAQPVPTGKMELKEGGKILAEATLTAGSATFKVPNLSPGTHVLTAYYLGDKHHEPSQSATVRQVVGEAHLTLHP